MTVTITATNSQLPTNSWTVTRTITASFTQTPIINQQSVIDNVIIYPNPYNPTKGDLKVKFDISQDCKVIKFKMYTTGFRSIRKITNAGNYSAGTNTVTIYSRWLDDLANGIYYVIIEAINKKGETIKSRPEVLVILK